MDRVSKSVEFMENGMNFLEDNVNELLRWKNKVGINWASQEVKRAQQGRGRDCSGQGPGIRTYIYQYWRSQGSEESQDS